MYSEVSTEFKGASVDRIKEVVQISHTKKTNAHFISAGECKQNKNKRSIQLTNSIKSNFFKKKWPHICN